MRHLTARWLMLAGFLFCARLHSATVTIDAGSVADSNFSGGTAYMIPVGLLPPGTSDSTMRYGVSFIYVIPCPNIPYVVRFHFIEPSVQGPGQRVFSVRINNQIMLDRLDPFAEAGYLKPFSRAVVVVGADEKLVIRFETQIRSAIVSAIDFDPL